MQNLQELPGVSSPLGAIDKKFEVVSSSDIVKKIRTSGSSQPRDTNNRVPRINSNDRDQSPLSPNQPECCFQASLVADKYLLLDQVEGSSLYRCVDVNTHEELVCKVSVAPL